MRSEHLVAVVVLFGVTTLVAIILLVYALVLYLAALLGSLTLSLLIVGSSSALISLMIYFGILRNLLRELHERLETLFEVASWLRKGSDWIRTIVQLF